MASYYSGALKRKKKADSNKRELALMSKVPKVSTFFKSNVDCKSSLDQDQTHITGNKIIKFVR